MRSALRVVLLVILLAVPLALSSRRPTVAAPPSPSSTAASPATADDAPTALLVQLAPAAAHRLAAAMTVQAVGGVVEAREQSIGVVRYRFADPASAAAALDLLRQDPGVASVSPLYVAHALTVPPPAVLFWQPYESLYMDAIHLRDAWAQGTGSPSVVVAVVDTGVNYRLPSVAQHDYKNYVELAGALGNDNDGSGCAYDVDGCNFVHPSTATGVGVGCPVQDSYFGRVDPYASTPNNDVFDDDYRSPNHGTAMASVVAAGPQDWHQGDPSFVGVAWRTSVLAVKVLDCHAEGNVDDIAAGVQYAMDRGSRVINLSLGFCPPAGYDATADPLRAAVERALARGIVVVASAGQYTTGLPDGASNCPTTMLPAAYPGVVSVGAARVMEDGSIVRGDWTRLQPDGRSVEWKSPAAGHIDIAAPGVGVLGQWMQYDPATGKPVLCALVGPCPTPFPGLYFGTSPAAAVVSGVVALMLARNPTLRPADVVRILRQTAQSYVAGDAPGWAGAGVIDAAAAVVAVPPAAGFGQAGGVAHQP